MGRVSSAVLALLLGLSVAHAGVRSTGYGPAGPQGDAGPAGPQGIAGKDGSAGPKGDTGPQGAAGANGKDGAAGAQGPQGPQGQTGATGATGAPKRVERYTANTGTGGIASFTFPACTAAADIQVIASWSGEQYVGGGVTAQTLSTATVQGMVSRGTLLLTTGPFTAAGSGVPITIRVICQ